MCPARLRGFDYVAMIGELRPRLPDLAAVVVLRGERRGGTVSARRRSSRHAAPPTGFTPRHAWTPTTVMRMAFTSGTTGNPKGVTHSHNTTLPAARILNGDAGVTEDEVFLV